MRQIKHWTPEEEQVIKDSFHLTKPQLAQLLGRTYQSVHRKIIEMGIYWGYGRKAKDCWTAEEDQYIKDNWLKIPTKEMVQSLNRSLRAIRNRKNAILGLTKRGLVNTQFFKNDSPEKYYVLGLIFADGNLYQGINRSGNPSYSFSIEISDGPELQKILDTLAPGRKVSSRIGWNKPLYCFKLTNKEMYEDLVSYGLHPNKSKTIQFPQNIPDQYLSDFVRGYFDGDGSICHVTSNDRWRVCFTSGSPAFLEGLRDRLHKQIGTSDKVTVQGFNVIYSKVEDVERIGNLMYKSVPSLFLVRKQERFMKALKWCWER